MFSTSLCIGDFQDRIGSVAIKIPRTDIYLLRYLRQQDSYYTRQIYRSTLVGKLNKKFAGKIQSKSIQA